MTENPTSRNPPHLQNGIDKRAIPLAKQERTIHDPILVAVGLAILVAGAIYYLIMRSPQELAIGEFLFWLPDWSHADSRAGLDEWFSWLPTFLHVLAFSLITAGIVNWPRLGAATWITINLSFEFSQITMGRAPIGDQSLAARFFLNGTYDNNDILAAIGGGVIAYAIVLSRSPRLESTK